MIRIFHFPHHLGDVMIKGKALLYFSFLILLLFGCTKSYAQTSTTKLVIRAQALNGKFIGSSLGGAYIIVKNADNGTILAKGFTEGSTGNTDLIMNPPCGTDTSISWGSAKFETDIEIEKPTFVTIEVYSPYVKKHAMVAAQTQLWLIPGKHIDGDGIIIQIPGFIVDALSPQTHNYMNSGQMPVKIKANVVLMCGCTVIKGSNLWNSDDYKIKALVYHDNTKVDEIPLKFIKPNTFEATYQPEEKGIYEIVIYAYDPQSGNTGVDKTTFIHQ